MKRQKNAKTFADDMKNAVEKTDVNEEYSRLSSIKSPEDLKKVDDCDIPELCEEIRRRLVDTVEQNGGHLASNLGVVELTVAMHKVFDCPKDHFIFDVGHQSYVHKLLTGRHDRFDTLRQGGGLSGFTKRSESEYDAFGAGHSSTSVSAALGFAQADKMSGSDAFTLCVLGDGAFTGGMVHEAINNVTPDLRLVIILNENEMSISKNIGSFAKNLAKIRKRTGYFKAKSRTRRIIQGIPLIGKGLFRFLRDTKKAIKNIMYGSNYFEDMGLYYLGPVDGNDYEAVSMLLSEAKRLGGSAVIHVKTKKGKGYEPAEEQPGIYHGMPPAAHKKPDGVDGNFSANVGRILADMANSDDKLCAITAAMDEGTGLSIFKTTHPERFFDVGIAEEHAMTFAAGLAAGGYCPVTAIYSTFMQRAYDQIIHDIALQKLHVIMCIDRAGLNAADGATHHGIFDVAFLSEIPGVTIFAPVTYKGLEMSLKVARENDGIYAIRYPSGYENSKIKEAFYPSDKPYPDDISVRTSLVDGDTPDAYIVVHGRLAAEALRAAELASNRGINVGIILAEYIKPYDRLAKEVAGKLGEGDAPVIFAEEEIRAGGFGMMLSDALCKIGALDSRKHDILAVDDNFVIQEKNEPIWHTAGVDAEAMAAAIDRMINNK